MMTSDDEGERGVWPSHDVITEIHFLANFWEFTGIFSKIFHKIFKFPKFNFPKIFKLRKSNSKI